MASRRTRHSPPTRARAHAAYRRTIARALRQTLHMSRRRIAALPCLEACFPVTLFHRIPCIRTMVMSPETLDTLRARIHRLLRQATTRLDRLTR